MITRLHQRSLAGALAPQAKPIATPTLPTWWPVRALQEYLVDSYQRSVLFLDVLRRRGNNQKAITSRPMATVLCFEHEIIMDGRSLPRPINYYLARIIPPAGSAIKLGKEPIIVVDPRAGQGPGIGGSKTESEIGAALAEGHPVYFFGFASEPVPHQTFLDVVEGQVSFVERVIESHPDSPRPIAFGNCQAGYQTLMVAMLRPDLFGTVIMAGSPMSYWQGMHGKAPLRYLGGLLGGSWLTALTSDLGNGKFDGAYLIANFDNLNPANFLWEKQYQVYANIDTEAQRYLGFERWWGDFIQLNGEEIQYLVDQLFIGDKLTRNELISNTGRVFDARNVTSPIICFTSMKDNISPPQQALGWILDLYRNVEEIRDRGRTIVYCIDPAAGHLAIFVSAKVAAKEDMAFVRTLDILDSLPPGLYEMLVTPKKKGESGAELVQGDFVVRFEPRTFDDIRALGRNSVEEDRAFATVARLSELNLSLYRTFVQPFIRGVVSEPLAQTLRVLNPLRLSYTLFADDNPAMAPVAELANQVRTDRRPAAADNPMVRTQESVSKYVEMALNAYRDLRDRAEESLFFAVYSSPIVQGLLGTSSAGGAPRRLPRLTPADEASFATARANARTKLRNGGVEEAIVRALLFVLLGERRFDERVAAAFRELHWRQRHLTHQELKQMVRDQAAVLRLEPDKAIESLPALVSGLDADRAMLLEIVTEVVGAAGPFDEAARERLDRLARILLPSRYAEMATSQARQQEATSPLPLRKLKNRSKVDHRRGATSWHKI